MFLFSCSNRIFQMSTERDVVQTYQTVSQISKQYHMLLIPPLLMLFLFNRTECKTILGLLDSTNCFTDWISIGDFSFNIPKGKFGRIETNIAIRNDGHNFLILTTKSKERVLNSVALKHFEPPATSLVHIRRHLTNLIFSKENHSNAIKYLQEENISSSISLENSNNFQSDHSSMTISHPTDIVETIESQEKKRKVYDSKENIPFQNDSHQTKDRSTLESRFSVENKTSSSPLNVYNFLKIQPNLEKQKFVSTTVCDALIESSRVSERLCKFPHQVLVRVAVNPYVCCCCCCSINNKVFEGKEEIFYLALNVDTSINREPISAVITRCMSIPSVQYYVTFTNPGNLFKKHFSYNDQGLLEIYLIQCIFLMCSLYWHKDIVYSLFILRDVYPSRRRRYLTFNKYLTVACKSTLVVDSLLIAAVSLTLTVTLQFLHLISYALDGKGLPIFSFLALISDFFFISTTAISINSLVFSSEPHLLESETLNTPQGYSHPSLSYVVTSVSEKTFKNNSNCEKNFQPISLTQIHSFQFCLTVFLLSFLFLNVVNILYQSPLYQSILLNTHFMHFSTHSWIMKFILTIFLLTYYVSRLKISVLLLFTTFTFVLQQKANTNLLFNPFFLFYSCSSLWFLSIPIMSVFLLFTHSARYFHLLVQVVANEIMLLVLLNFLNVKLLYAGGIRNRETHQLI